MIFYSYLQIKRAAQIYHFRAKRTAKYCLCMKN
jgi:hypothetical protein